MTHPIVPNSQYDEKNDIPRISFCEAGLSTSTFDTDFPVLAY